MVDPARTSHDAADGALVDPILTSKVDLPSDTSSVPTPDFVDLLVAQLGPGIVGTTRLQKPSPTSVGDVLAGCDVLKVRRPVIGLAPVDVVDRVAVPGALIAGRWAKERFSNQRMDVCPTAPAVAVQCDSRVPAAVGRGIEDAAVDRESLAVTTGHYSRQRTNATLRRYFIRALKVLDWKPLFRGANHDC